MANLKITELNALGATPDDTDVLAIVDNPGGAAETKKVTYANLMAGAAGGFNPFGGVNALFTHGLNPNNFDSSIDGSGAYSDTTTEYGISLYTTASANSYCRIYIDPVCAYKGWSTDRMVSVTLPRVMVSANGAAYFLYSTTSYDYSSAQNYFGFKITASSGSDTVYAISDNDGTEQATDVTASFGSTTTYEYGRILTAVYTAGTDVKFYKNSTLLATHSTNIPDNSDTTTANYPFVFAVNNASDSENTQIDLAGITYGVEML